MALIQLTEEQTKLWSDLERFLFHQSTNLAQEGEYERAANVARLRQFVSHVAEYSLAASQQHTVFCPLCHGQGAL